MPTAQQVRNLQELSDLLAEQNQVGPIDPPKVGARYHCGGGRPCWLYDTTTTQFAAQLAVQRDPATRGRRRVLGILPFGRRRNPLVQHYGLSQEQIRTMTEIDTQTIPDAENQGRLIWLQRQQAHIQEVISPGSRPYTNHHEPAIRLQVTIRAAAAAETDRVGVPS